MSRLTLTAQLKKVSLVTLPRNRPCESPFSHVQSGRVNLNYAYYPTDRVSRLTLTVQLAG